MDGPTIIVFGVLLFFVLYEATVIARYERLLRMALGKDPQKGEKKEE